MMFPGELNAPTLLVATCVPVETATLEMGKPVQVGELICSTTGTCGSICRAITCLLCKSWKLPIRRGIAL